LQLLIYTGKVLTTFVVGSNEPTAEKHISLTAFRSHFFTGGSIFHAMVNIPRSICNGVHFQHHTGNRKYSNAAQL